MTAALASVVGKIGPSVIFWTTTRSVVVDQTVEKAVTSRNAKERDGYMRKAQEILTQDPVAIYLLATKETVGMSLKVNGIINSPLELVFADKDTWKER